MRSIMTPDLVEQMQKEQEQGKRRPNFRTMTRERHREVARMGGKSSFAKGKIRLWTAEEARAHGAAGGRQMHINAKARKAKAAQEAAAAAVQATTRPTETSTGV